MMRSVYLLLVIAVGAAALILSDEGFEPPAPEPAVVREALPRYSVTGAEWLRLDARGEPELRARAATIDYYADESVRMRTLTLDALGGLSSPWTMTAPTGVVPPHERRVLLKGGVLAHGKYADTPVTFTTSELWVDLLRRELLTEAPVVLDSEFRRAKARGLRADFSGEHVQLLNDVQVEYVPKS